MLLSSKPFPQPVPLSVSASHHRALTQILKISPELLIQAVVEALNELWEQEDDY